METEGMSGDALLQVLATLGNPHRLRVVAALAEERSYVSRLAREYRRLADIAITAQEHTDLKLSDVSAPLDYLREQNASLQRLLKDVG